MSSFTNLRIGARLGASFAALLLLLLAIVAIAMQVRRYRLGSVSIRAERGRPTPWAVIFLTSSVCLIAALSIASVIKISLL